MTKITREIRINAPKEEVWPTLADFGNIYKFNPTVPHSYSTNAQSGGLGAMRHCDLNIPGASLEERVIRWVDGEEMEIEIFDSTKAPPFKTAFATISVRSEGENASVARGTIQYTMKYGPIGALMDLLVVKPQFSTAWAGLLAGLKHHIETGEKVEGLKGLDLSNVQVAAA